MILDQADIYKGPRSDEYGTPGWVFNPLHEQYGFAIDLAATGRNTKTLAYFSAENSFLQPHNRLALGTRHWCNPPFSLAAEFFAKIAAEARRGASIVCIYKSANMETAGWRHIFSECSWIAQPDRRVNYLVDGVEAKGVQFASAVIGFNVERPNVPWKHALLRVERGNEILGGSVTK